MIRRMILALAAIVVLSPLTTPADAQTVDTLEVEVLPDLQTVVIQGPISLTMGDTATFRWYGLDSNGDSVGVSGTLVSLSTGKLEVLTSSDPSSARVVAIGRGAARLTVTQVDVIAAMDGATLLAGPAGVTDWSQMARPDDLQWTVGQERMLCAYFTLDGEPVGKAPRECPDPPSGHLPAVAASFQTSDPGVFHWSSNPDAAEWIYDPDEGAMLYRPTTVIAQRSDLQVRVT